MTTQDVIYLVFVNSDPVEGRGRMVHLKNSGFFTSEDDAWAFADSVPGIMGRRPLNGSWKNDKYPDVEVRAFRRHQSEYYERKNDLQSRIAQLQNELMALESERSRGVL